MKIHITGASCSGVTTLGLQLSKSLDIPYFDSDYFFWEKTDPPFTTRRLPELRNVLLFKELSKSHSWIIGGSIINWSLNLEFDLVVFLLLPKELRLERLKKREFERYGDIIYSNKERHAQYMEFFNWASGYDDNTAQDRTLLAHQEWLEKLSSPVLELTGDLSVLQRVDKVMEIVSSL